MKEMGNFPFKPKAAVENNSKSLFLQIERCWNCPNAVIDIDGLEKSISAVMEESNFEIMRGKALNTDKPMHHQVFRISVSGCPNSCSQPQIKDLGIIGQAIPEVGPGCTLCGECVKSCPDGLITLYEWGPEIDRGACLYCGRCARACPAGVLTTSATGYRVLVGGKLGRHPRLAETAVAVGKEKSVKSTVKAAVDLLTAPEYAKERLGSIIEKKGVDWFKEKTLSVT